MDAEGNFEAPAEQQPLPAFEKIDPSRFTNTDTNPSRSFTTSSSSSSSSSPPGLLRHVQAAFKRHRPLGVMQSNNIKPKRLLPQRETSKGTVLNVDPSIRSKQSQDDCSVQTKDILVGDTQGDASITPPSSLGHLSNSHVENVKPFGLPKDQNRNIGKKNNDTFSSSILGAEQIQFVEEQKKVQFTAENNIRSPDTDWEVSNQPEASSVISLGIENHKFQSAEGDFNFKSGCGISSMLTRSSVEFPNQLHLQGDFSQPMTQSSVNGSSCATTSSVHYSSAPMFTSHHLQSSNSLVIQKSLGEVDCNYKPVTNLDALQPSVATSSDIDHPISGHIATTGHVIPGVESQIGVREYNRSRYQESETSNKCEVQKSALPCDYKSTKEKGHIGDVTDVQSQAPLLKHASKDVNGLQSKIKEKTTNAKGTTVPHKRNYDPDLFFKVNGKLYQRLGKIGSGGSSEVHKVISSDCAIYALKKIKLKGRDYATAHGFCQEIEYLNKLKGKNIIQLIDYEVTDNNLLKEVMNGSMNIRDGRIKEDGYIYMVLEYGEIDLAHMLSQKWKDLDDSKLSIDENWLRFYWQQILLAVNTIHDERIVHSDLKPANFLLVRGSLKLIDFGIAKAIMSDTTNIQRDSQVGTLSYMSPEAFLCNETDVNGNPIKCGRPSDIWSLGCILYQMVYGRTPFSQYKTFWAKFKVITDPNHEITYEPVSNPWLIDLMKKCLAWDRNERWRIPQLLQHPFLAPPTPSTPSSLLNFDSKLLQLIADCCGKDSKGLLLCLHLQQLLGDLRSDSLSESPMTLNEVQKLLLEMSNICIQVQQKIENTELV